MTLADFSWHGGRLGDARTVFGDKVQPWIDFSTGADPLPWPDAAAAYADTAWMDATRGALPARAAALNAVLEAHGFSLQGACPPFRLVKIADAGAAFEWLAHHAILSRPFAGHSCSLRFGLPADEDQLARLGLASADG